MPRSRIFAEWLAVLAGALALACWALLQGTTGRFDMALLDRVATYGAAPASDDIILVAIDDRSLREVGQWPWDRRKLAELTDRIAATGPRLVELDILFPEPSLADADAALARSIAAFGKVVLPFGFTAAENRLSGVDPVLPIPELAGAAAALGHVALVPDSDGSIRRVSLALDDDARSHPQLQAAAVRVLKNRQPPSQSVETQAPVVPLRAAGAYRSVSASAVLRGEVPADFLRGRLVLVGATAEGLGDIHPVPYAAGSLMPGVELQANLLQAMLEGGLIGTAPQWLALAFCCLPVMVLFAGFWRLRPAACLWLAIGLVLALPLMSAAVAHFARLWLVPGPALLAIIVAYPLWGWRRLAALSDYLLAKSMRLAEAGAAVPPASGGFDEIAREVGQLDYLVDEVSARRDFLRRVIETAPDAICVFDGQGCLLLLNGHAQAIFPQAQAPQSFEAMLATASAAPGEHAEELALPDGRILALARSNEAAHDGWQAISIVSLADVTAQRRAEKDRRAMLEFLSHDMRAPQVAILNLASEGREESGRLGRIRGHARRTMQLADNFVQLARLADSPLARDEVDLGALAAEAADRAFDIASARRTAIKLDMPEDPLFAIADGQVLSRVFDNLVGNAVKYGRESGLVTIVVARAGDEGVISIADDGPGLPEARQVEPFQRFGPRDRSGGGAGLGLNFVAEALARHGAKIAVESAPGEGTRFTISLAVLPDLPDA